MGAFDILRRVVGVLWGRVVPDRPAPAPNPPLDARDFAIAALFDYLAGVAFTLDGGPAAPPERFRIPRPHFLDEYPQAPKQLTFPSVVCLPGENTIIPNGFTNGLDEASRDRFGDGTALLVLHEHQERLIVECWGTTRFQRAAIAAGIERALDPSEQGSGLRLTLPDYFDRVARFTIDRSDRVDDADSGRDRRRHRFTVRMEVDVVRLVRVVPLVPTVETVVQSGGSASP